MRKYHTCVWVPVQHPAGQTRPLIITAEGEILIEAWAFLSSYRYTNRSSSWFTKAVKYIGYFYDFYRVSYAEEISSEFEADQLISRFFKAISGGTIQLDGSDPTGLHWKPWSATSIENATHVIREFLLSLSDGVGEEHLSKTKFARSAISSLALENKKKRSILWHLASRNNNDRGQKQVTYSRTNTLTRGTFAKCFPQSILPALLFDGCRRSRASKAFSHPIPNEYNINLMLALTLLAGGGIRKSEIFHMFADDVRREHVRLYDPIYGGVHQAKECTRGKVMVRRDIYLREEYGRVPRNRLPSHDTEHAGWKSMLVDYLGNENYSIIQWPHKKMKELFYYLLKIYVTNVLPKRMNHPYLFISLSHSEYGMPWTISAFNSAFSQAMSKIGERTDRNTGRNPHGLRHLYGQTLTDLGLSPVYIQQAMHHKSIASQLIYTRPSPEKVRKALEHASNDAPISHRLVSDTDLLSYDWRSDPLKLFAPWNLGNKIN